MPVLKQLHQLFLAHRKIGAVLILAFLIGLSCSVVYRGAISEAKRSDATVFMTAAQALHDGANIYEVTNHRNWNYVYTPLLAVLMMPFTGLPLAVTLFLWYLLSIAALIGTIKLSYRLFSDNPCIHAAVFAATIFSIPLFLDTLARGQLGVLVLFFATAVFYLYRFQKPWQAGILLSFIVVLKTTPLAVLFFYFLFKKEWKIVAASILGGLFFLLVLPSTVIGFKQNWLYLLQWREILHNAVFDISHTGQLWRQLMTPFADDNQSFYAALSRWVWRTDESMIGHANTQIRQIVSALGVVSLITVFFMIRRNCHDRSIKQEALEYAVFPMIMLLISPVSEMHHFTVVYLLYLIMFLIQNDFKPGSPSYFVCMAMILIGGFSYLTGLISDEAAYWGTPVVGLGLLWIYAIICGYHRPKAVPLI